MAKDEKEKIEAAAPESKGINARIIDEDEGLRELQNVAAIRIRSTNYNLLIMEDYLPILGQVSGSVVFVLEDQEIPFEGVEGFFKHHHNEFTLIVERKTQ